MRYANRIEFSIGVAGKVFVKTSPTKRLYYYVRNLHHEGKKLLCITVTMTRDEEGFWTMRGCQYEAKQHDQILRLKEIDPSEVGSLIESLYETPQVELLNSLNHISSKAKQVS